MRKDSNDVFLPLEPRGMGAFFALNNFMGNYDCIGGSGGNVGFDTDSNKLIIVDGGEARTTHKINKLMPSSANNKTWLSYDELSNEAKKEASETFVRIASLDDMEIRALVTNNEQFVDSRIFTEEEIEKKIGDFRKQQLNTVEVYYDSMVLEGCDITPRVETLKKEVDELLIEEKEREAELEDQKRNILGKREEDDSFSEELKLPYKVTKRRIALAIDPNAESTIFSIGNELKNIGVSALNKVEVRSPTKEVINEVSPSTPTNMEVTSPPDKENTPERVFNRGRGGSSKVRS